jgi:predicted RNase H-like nuclease (RuvC/YqgF family)
MREKLFQMLFRHRMELLAAQEMAGREVHELEQRLERLQLPLQERISAYERRIGELERNLERMGDENRELTRVRIEVAKERLTVARGEFQSN